MPYPQSAAPPISASPDDTGPLAPGTLLGELQIVRRLGDSGFGVVYLARDNALDLTVAIKEYLPATLAVHGAFAQVRLRDPVDGDAFERGRLAFINEARILAHCDHPSLLRVHRVWEANGTVYRVMPHYPGQNLLAVRRGMSKPPNETSLRALLDALLGALEALHNAGHAHGAVTPANILLLPDDRPLLMDCGAVRRAILDIRPRRSMAGLEFSGALPGAGPAAEAQGPSGDLHALAAVAQFCISGELPALTPAAHAGLGREPPPGVLAGLSACAAKLHYSASLCATLDAMLAAQPNDVLCMATQCRALLQDHAARVPGRADPGLNLHQPATSALLGFPEPDFTEEKFVADLNESMAAAARQVKLRETAAATRSLHVAAEVPSRARPRLLRVASWSGATLVALALGAAGWKMNEHLAEDAAVGRFAALAGPDRMITAPTGPPGDRWVAPGEALMPPPRQQAAARPPAAVDGRRAAPREAPAPAQDVAVGAAAKAATGPAERDAGPELTADKAAPRMRTAARAGGSPREECGTRSEFALYRCMQAECAQARWAAHAQCARLRATDEVD